MWNLTSNNVKGFHWEYTEAPHASRRIEILSKSAQKLYTLCNMCTNYIHTKYINILILTKHLNIGTLNPIVRSLEKYPQIRTLMKLDGDRKMVIFGLFVMVAQYLLAYFNNISTPIGISLNITIGAFLSSAMFMQIHEAAHGLSFGPNHVWKNRLYGLLLNFGMSFPLFGNFKKHHKEHHKYQAVENLDVEYPFEFEARYFSGPLGKYIWMILNPSLQTYRSSPTKWSVENFTTLLTIEEKIGIALIIVFDMWLIFSGRFYFLANLFFSSFVGMSMNTIGFWNIVSHTEFFKFEETSNYYGWMNSFMSNFGYHMEHHDFPNIPSRFLPQVILFRICLVPNAAVFN